MSFWNRVEYAIWRAFEDGRYLPDPQGQELVMWHDVRTGRNDAKLIQFRARWFKSVDTMVSDERNFA
jgi:hypothetical protein